MEGEMTPMAYERKSRRSSTAMYVIGDALAIAFAYFLTLLVRFHMRWGEALYANINAFLGVRDTGDLGDELAAFYVLNAPRILLLLSGALLFLYAFLDLYDIRRHIRRRFLVRNVAIANLVALLVFYTYFYLTQNRFHPRSLFVTVLFVNVVFCVLFRHGVAWLQRRGGRRCPAVLVGGTHEANFIEQYLVAAEPAGLRVAERVRWTPDAGVAALRQPLREATDRHGARLVICADKRLTVPQIMEFLDVCTDLGVEAKVLSDRMNVLVNEAGTAADFFFESPLIHFARWRGEGVGLYARRALSAAGAALALAVLSPLLLAVAGLIRLTSPGPALFVQERIGVNLKPFRMLKFRTMRTDAEQTRAEVEEFNETGDVMFKMRRDPRVTRVGGFLRRLSLDELPQLINVVRGEMTLVGPRPLPRRDFEGYYEKWHYSRHNALPGLTCLWQVSGRSEIDFHNMCILDVYYLHNQGFMLDLKILLRTLGVVLFAKGAY
jgi:exopolysaccharide biosynthesis polyprenyl glycosylphosphotransferase